MRVLFEIVGLFFFMGFASCSDNEQVIVSEGLSLTEKNNLLQLREEEKLARDVYLFAFEKYGLPIFNNISESEQRHMSAVLNVLNYFEIEDVALREHGSFRNEELQDLYNTLTKKVAISLEEALKVGATIEDLDIYDIQNFKKQTKNQVILNMYDKLECGSRNHMRAFYSQLAAYDIVYQAQFISQIALKDIVNSERERCGKKQR